MVADSGVDNYQLICADREQFVINAELSLTADNVEKLGVVMHMRCRMPVAAIPCTANIAQF